MELMEGIVVAVIETVFILSVAGVIILRPLSKRLGELLELMYTERQSGLGDGVTGAERLHSIERRVADLEGGDRALGPGKALGDQPAPRREENTQ